MSVGVDQQGLERDGFGIADCVITEERRMSLIRCFEEESIALGHRRGLELASVRELALELLAVPLVVGLVGDDATAVRAILFDKSARANWPVAFHQDSTVPVERRVEAAGFQAWSVKDGVVNVRPPARVLESMLTVRVDLDGSDSGNGALRVIPGSHRGGFLSQDDVERAVASHAAVTCKVPAGGALLMRPLLLHGSRRQTQERHRRIVHVELASEALPGPLEWPMGSQGPAAR
jgi:hypothetical protein